MPYQICVLWFLVEFDLSYLLLILCYAILFQESLKYRLNGSESDIGSWGHEYVRNLAGEIAKEYTIRQVSKQFGLWQCSLARGVSLIFWQRHGYYGLLMNIMTMGSLLNMVIMLILFVISG